MAHSSSTSHRNMQTQQPTIAWTTQARNSERLKWDYTVVLIKQHIYAWEQIAEARRTQSNSEKSKILGIHQSWPPAPNTSEATLHPCRMKSRPGPTHTKTRWTMNCCTCRGNTSDPANHPAQLWKHDIVPRAKRTDSINKRKVKMKNANHTNRIRAKWQEQ